MVSCDERDVVRYGRIVGRCLAGDLDMNEWLVIQGLALAYRRYSRDYISAENEARAAGRGLWAGSSDSPWEWRHRHRAAAPLYLIELAGVVLRR